jgi:RimJ/RimL family protein N-acetyltransferase
MDIVRMHSGEEAIIRPISSGDGPALRAAYERLSPETRYQRFLAPKPHLSEAEVRYFVDVDGSNHLALVATLVTDPDRIIGVARLVRLPEHPQTAELAVLISDPFQGEGLATALLERLIAAAPERGIRRMRATMLADNQAAHRLVRGLAKPQTYRQLGTIDETEVELAP